MRPCLLAVGARSLLRVLRPVRLSRSARGGVMSVGMSMNNAQRREELLATWRAARKACAPKRLPNGITVRYDDERVERFAAYALSDALLSELIADAERLDWWEQHLRYEHQMNFDPEEISDGVVDF